jgi:hypothetical protein
MFHPGMILSDHLAQCIQNERLTQPGHDFRHDWTPADQPKLRWPALLIAAAAILLLGLAQIAVVA